MTRAPGRVALVVNPVARKAARARREVEMACAAAGLPTPLVLTTTVEDPGPGQARAALDAGCRRVVVAGGDGTVRLVAGEVTRADDGELGIVPAGTADLAARSLGLARRPVRRAARVAVSAPARPVDLGVAELTRASGESDLEPFLVVVGVGHDAQILAGLDARAKARGGWLAYVTPGLRLLRRVDRPVTVQVDDGDGPMPAPVADDTRDEHQERVWSVLVVNAARLPLGARVVPAARPDDGLLHLALVAPRSLVDWARIARTGWGGRHRDDAALRYARGRVVTLRMPDAPVQVDGDVVADIVGARVEIRPGALRVAGALGGAVPQTEGA